MLLAWSRLLGQHFQLVPGHPDWGYYGDGGHQENAVRPICYAAWTNAFLAETEPPSGGPTACASRCRVTLPRATWAVTWFKRISRTGKRQSRKLCREAPRGVFRPPSMARRNHHIMVPRKVREFHLLIGGVDQHQAVEKRACRARIGLRALRSPFIKG